MKYYHGRIWLQDKIPERHLLKRCDYCKHWSWNHKWTRLTYLYVIMYGAAGIPGPPEKTAYACCEQCASTFQPQL